MRIIPGKLKLNGDPVHCEPWFIDEPDDMRSSRLFPLSVGDVIIRDARLWHGGTPNLSNETRFLPNIELASASFSEVLISRKELWAVLPHHLFSKLSPRCQEHCPAVIVADPAKEFSDGIR